MLHPGSYHSYWHSADKPGYSGVAIYSKKEPIEVRYGMGIPEIDREGRVILAEFPDLVLVNAYFPNSQRDHARLGFTSSPSSRGDAQVPRKEMRKKGKNLVDLRGLQYRASGDRP